MALTAGAAESPAPSSGASAQADAGAALKPGGSAAISATPSSTAGRAGSALDRRIALLARELELDDTQKAKVRTLLVTQREQVLRVWNDESVPGALRVKHTQLISERTEDAIRALLTDVQMTKYSKARPAGVVAGGTSADLATWMDKVNRR
jgi:Spy/CpxP family protein refolding chaperone